MPPYEENDNHFVDSGIQNSSDQRKSSEEGDHQGSGSVEPHRPTLSEVRDFLAPTAGDVGASAPRPTSSPREPEGVAATLARVNLSTTSSGVRSETGAHLSLAALCSLIESTPTLAEAEILSVECYTQWSHVVIHRFVVLHLHRQGKRGMYLRMDRRVDQQVKNNQALATLKFLFASGKTAANDEAQLSPIKGRLVQESAKLESSFTLKPPYRPTLGALKVFLDVIIRELVEYKLWPENCWFFCSLVQQYLSNSTGVWDTGYLTHPGQAMIVRHKVHEGVRLAFHQPREPTITHILHGLEEAVTRSTTRELQNTYNATLIRSLDFDRFESDYRGVPGNIIQDMVVHTNSLVLSLWRSHRGGMILSLRLLPQIIRYLHLYPNSFRSWQRELAMALWHYSLCMHDLPGEEGLEKASIAINEAVELLDEPRNFDDDPDRAEVARLYELYDDCWKLKRSIDTSMGRLTSAQYAAKKVVHALELRAAREPTRWAQSLGIAHQENAELLCKLERYKAGFGSFEAALQKLGSGTPATQGGISHFFRPKSASPSINQIEQRSHTLTTFAQYLLEAARAIEALKQVELSFSLLASTPSDADKSQQLPYQTIRGLQAHSAILSALGRHPEACSRAKIVTEKYGDVDIPFHMDIANAWLGLGECLWAAKRFNDAIKVYRKVEQIYDKGIRLAERAGNQNSSDKIPELCSLYSRRAAVQTSLQSWRAALRSSRCCIDNIHLRELLPRLESHHAVDLAGYLNQHGSILLHLREYAAARAAFEEASRIYRSVIDWNPVVHTRQYAIALDGRASASLGLGLYHEAAQISIEALRLSQQVRDENPQIKRHKLLLAQLLTRNASLALYTASGISRKDASKRADDAIVILRELTSSHPHEWSIPLDLVAALQTKAQVHLAASHGNRASVAFEDAVEVYRSSGLIESMREIYDADRIHRAAEFANILDQYGNCLLGVRDHAQTRKARESLSKARELFESLAHGREAVVYLEPLGKCTLALAECALEARVYDQAIESASSAMSAFDRLHESHRPNRPFDEFMLRAMWILLQAHVALEDIGAARNILARKAHLIEPGHHPFDTRMWPMLERDILELEARVSTSST